MTRKPLIALVGTIVAVASLTGVASAVPGDGPPDDASGPIPEFVTDGVGSAGDLVGDLLDDVFGFVEGLTPDAAQDGLDTARDAVPGG